MYACQCSTEAVIPLLPQEPPNPAINPNPVPLLHCSTRPPDRYGFSHTFLLAKLSSIVTPNSYFQAMKHKYWQQAMKEELNALQENQT